MTEPRQLEMAGVALAQAIAGNGSMPAWLPKACARVIGHLRSLLAGELQWPTRDDYKERLKALVQAAQLVLAEMGRGEIVGLLDKSAKLEPDTGEVINPLYQVATGCEWVIKHGQAAIGLIRDGSGRDKYYLSPDGFVSQVILCSFIYFLWIETHGKAPPITSPRSIDACVMAWRDAGGQEIGHSGNGWTRHMRAARDNAAHPGLRAAVKTIIVAAQPTA